MSTIIFGLDHFGGIFEAKLLKSDGTVRSLLNNTLVEAIFVKPDGKKIRKVAALKDPGTPADTEITWTDNISPTIFDHKGYWEFYVAATFALAFIPSHERISFWVE